MFGLADRYFTENQLKKNWKVRTPFGPEILKDIDNEPSSWFCFVPSTVISSRFLNWGILPKKGNRYLYQISSKRIITNDPEETIEKLNEIYEDVIKRVDSELQRGNKPNFLGVSLGNVISVRAASNFSQKGIGKLVSLVGGANLGYSGWDSILTGHVVKESKCSREEYERRVSEFSPINYVEGIDAELTTMRISRHDLLIRYDHGEKLAKAFSNGKRLIDLKTYNLSDHCTGLLHASAERLTH